MRLLVLLRHEVEEAQSMTCEACDGKGIVSELIEVSQVWHSTDGKTYVEELTICPKCDGRET